MWLCGGVMAGAWRDYAGSVNLRCLPCGTRAPILPTADGRRAAAYLRRLGWQRHPKLDWCCPECAARLVSGDLDADELLAEVQHDAAARIDAILGQPPR